MDMELTYIYHSGFALSGDGFTVIMDYYRDSEDGQAQADFCLLYTSWRVPAALSLP